MATGEICSKMAEQVTCSQPNSGESLQQQQLQSNEDIPYRNRLHEFARRAKIQFLLYRTVNKGENHAPMFRSTVVVDGNTYKSSNTFSTRREAEQDAAKSALEGISRKIIDWISKNTTDDGFPSLDKFQEKGFCKSVLLEFAEKMNLKRPKFKTASIEGVFVSSVVCGGVKYTGEARKSKKEAQQDAAREAIVSILGFLGLGTILPDIIKSKAECFSSECCSDVRVCVSPVGLNYSGNDTEASVVKEGVTVDEDANKPENLTENAAPISLDEQISDVQPLQDQPDLDLSNCDRKRKSKDKKKKADKKLKTEAVAAS